MQQVQSGGGALPVTYDGKISRWHLTLLIRQILEQSATTPMEAKSLVFFYIDAPLIDVSWSIAPVFKG
jgi:hypothetical protein